MDGQNIPNFLDETTDGSHVKQMSFVVSFFPQMQINERFFQVCDVTGTTAKSFENVVVTLPEENGLKVKDVRGQGYDGAANMSGSYKGLQPQIQSHNEKALYMHCHAHSLNLS